MLAMKQPVGLQYEIAHLARGAAATWQLCAPMCVTNHLWMGIGYRHCQPSTRHDREIGEIVANECSLRRRQL